MSRLKDVQSIYTSINLCSNMCSIHFKLTPSMSCFSLIRCLKRFVGRKGKFNMAISDNFQTFICHHHSFNVSVPLKVGHTAPMFVLSFFLHSILFAGSALDSFQCLISLLIVSFHVFFGLPRPRCPTTSNSVMLLIQSSFLTTCPNQRSRLYRNKVCMLLIPSFL